MGSNYVKSYNLKRHILRDFTSAEPETKCVTYEKLSPVTFMLAAGA